MISLWPLLLIFVTVVVGLAGVYSLLSDLWLRDRQRISQRVDEEFLKNQRERARNTSPFKELDRLAAELATEEPRLSWRGWLVLLVEQAGLDYSPRTFLIASAGTAFLAGAVVGALTWSLLLAVPAALLAVGGPLWFLCWRKQRRLAKILAQLPDAFESMARVLRAGHTLTQALQMVVRDFNQPLAGEFAYCYEQQNLGLSPAAAYQDLARRVGLFEVRIFALAMSVQQQTGGNIAELLDRLTANVRERHRAALRLLALTGESRLQANVLLALPPVMFAVLWVLKREYIALLFKQPLVLLGMFVAQVLGACGFAPS